MPLFLSNNYIHKNNMTLHSKQVSYFSVNYLVIDGFYFISVNFNLPYKIPLISLCSGDTKLIDFIAPFPNRR